MPKSSDEARRLEGLSSDALAALVVDGLIDAGIVKREDAERAIRIAGEEIQTRGDLGDY